MCQTLSKALEKSQKTKQLNSFFQVSLRSNCIVIIVLLLPGKEMTLLRALYSVDGELKVLAKPRLIFIYEIVFDEMIVNMLINNYFH